MANSIGARLREERQRLGLTQAEAAKMGGVGRATFLFYESGENSPQADCLALLMGVGFDAAYVVTGTRSGVVDTSGLDTITTLLLGATDSFGGVLDRLVVEPDPNTLQNTISYLRGALDSFRAALLRAQSQKSARADLSKPQATDLTKQG